MPRTKRNIQTVSVEPVVSANAETQESNTVSVVLCKDIILKIVGKHTGQLYTFYGAGSILEVDELDAAEMMKKNVAPSCCGSYSTPYFQIIGR